MAINVFISSQIAQAHSLILLFLFYLKSNIATTRKMRSKRESKEREKGKMKQVIDSSHIMLTTLNILGARLLLACSHSLASLQCVSSDLRLNCCSILSLISHATITFFGTFVQASSKQDADEVSRLSRLQSLLSIALFVNCFFTLSVLLHNLIFSSSMACSLIGGG